MADPALTRRSIIRLLAQTFPQSQINWEPDERGGEMSCFILHRENGHIDHHRIGVRFGTPADGGYELVDLTWSLKDWGDGNVVTNWVEKDQTRATELDGAIGWVAVVRAEIGSKERDLKAWGDDSSVVALPNLTATCWQSADSGTSAGALSHIHLNGAVFTQGAQVYTILLLRPGDAPNELPVGTVLDHENNPLLFVRVGLVRDIEAAALAVVGPITRISNAIREKQAKNKRVTAITVSPDMYTEIRKHLDSLLRAEGGPQFDPPNTLWGINLRVEPKLAPGSILLETEPS